jgi:uncharacterized protein (DUF1810 family)
VRQDLGVPDDPFALSRFLDAQDRDDTYERAYDELRRARKESHWMWFVFPQFAGLGQSPTSRHFAIGSLAEARAYLDHPVLGERLRECARLVAETAEPPESVFGPLDARKLHSSVTLFARADPDDPAFRAVLDAHFAGRPDGATDQLLAASASAEG